MEVKYYLTSSGRSPVREFILAESNDIRTKFFDAVSELSMGKILQMPLSRNLSSLYHGLYEIRLRDREGQIRVFYLITKHDAIYMLHAMQKKSEQILKRDIEIIMRRIKEI
jgi:phage-related protein